MTRGGPRTLLSSSADWGYRPSLDGLRTVAVYLVVAFHAGVVAIGGGFIGVDLFFALSGFLVTSVLLAEYAGGEHIRLGRFYARRVRRLLPAAVMTIIAIAVMSVFIEPPLTRAGHVDDARSALVYVSNWHFVNEATDYFAQDVHTSPYLHFWSLSVEEQFYLAFPLLLIGLLALARRWGRPALAVAGGAAILAVAVTAQLWWADRDPLRAYYGTDARVYQMLAGAVLAMVLARPAVRHVVVTASSRTRRIAGGAAAVGLAAIVAASTDWWPLTPSRRGLVAALSTVVVIGALELSRPSSPVTRLLSHPPIVYLGKISYGTYLWHWPIIVFTRQVLDLGPVALAVVAGVGATALASLSFVLLESPVRASAMLSRFAWPVVASGLAASVLAAVVVVPAILNSDRRPVVDAAGVGGAGTALAGTVSVTAASTTTSAPSTTTPPTSTAAAGGGAAAALATTTAGPPATATATTVAVAPAPPTTVLPLDQIAVPPDLDLAAAASFTTGQFGCADGTPEDCILVPGAAPHVFVLGDSNAAMMMPMFQQLAADHGFTLSATTAAGCTWQRGLGWEVADQTLVEDCVRIRDDAYDRVIPALHPDLVITVHVSRDDPARPSPPFVALDDTLGTGTDAIAAATARSLDALTAMGLEVLLVEPFPYGSFDTVQCLSGVDLVIDCAFQGSVDPSPTEVIYRAEAEARPDVSVVDFDRLVCPFLPLCLPILDDELVFRDALHVYPPWLVAHRAEVWGRLVASGATLSP